MKTEKEKMLAGELYNSLDPELMAERLRCRTLVSEFNLASPDEIDRRQQILASLLGKVGKGTWIEPTFRCDYGCNIEIGDNTMFNFDCVILDCAKVSIGSNVLIAPGVHIYAAYHPLEAKAREEHIELEYAAPVTIGNNVWIGGRSIICPGVSIGDNTVIGAGSVVTKDIPAGVIAAGNPCRVLRKAPV